MIMHVLKTARNRKNRRPSTAARPRGHKTGRSLLSFARSAGRVAAVVGIAVSAGANEPWRELYRGEAAEGTEVIALWQLLPGAETVDRSGNGHELTLRGESRFAEDGLFGSCLESFATEGSERHGATAGNHASLSPEGAFTLELWVRPKAGFFEQPVGFLIDKKYYHYDSDHPRANQDYLLMLRRSGRTQHMVAMLGFGEDSASYRSDDIELKEGEWAYVAFTYNGAGMGRFFLNGEPVGDTYHEGRGPVTPGRHPLVLGDRVGSNFMGFAGFIDQVRIMNGNPPWLAPRAAAAVEGGRTVFERMEPNARVAVTINNGLDLPLEGLTATAVIDGMPLAAEIGVPHVSGRSAVPVEFDVDTRIKPGAYPLTVRFAGRAGEEEVTFEAEGTVTITPRPMPHEMPVVMWGFANTQTMDEIGFTHSLLWLADHGGVWGAGEPVVPVRSGDRLASAFEQLDARLAAGQRFLANVRPGRWVVAEGGGVAERREQFGRVDRDGERLARNNTCGLFPEVQEFAGNVGTSVGQTFGHHPAFDGAMIHTEVRDGSNLCFHEHDREAYRAYSGREIPDEAVSRGGIPVGRRGEFVPGDGIVEDDHPILDYYRWFWREGDGWNELHSRTHHGLKTGTRPGFWTFFDPAVRCPPTWGSGGEVDVISQWTYTYPEPPRIGLATDEVFAMAAGRPGQQVMKMTQIIWYRNQTAPNLPEREEDRTDWERQEPEARFITIAPDHLREAFWLKIARPVQGIMYHGIGSLTGSASGSYRYTNPETREALTELIRDVVRPLGPALMQIPDAPSDVALLQSFTSMVFGAEPTWGWGRGWVAEMHQLLQWARLQPRVIYEDTILRDGLDGIRVLVMPNCPVLPRSVARKIAEFQQQGGLVVGDPQLATGIVPDILVERPAVMRRPDANKAALQALAENLRAELAPVYVHEADSSDADVIVRMRAYGDTGYLFAINDKRTYGDYVGQHGRVMEQGLPHEAVLSVRRPGASVYDVLESAEVETRATETGVEWDASFGPGAGRVYMVSPRPVDRLTARVSERQGSNPQVDITVTVACPTGRPLAAVVPVQVEITDPAGVPAEFSGHYGAAGGETSIRLELAENDRAGEWTVRVRELASGKTAETTFPYAPR